MAKAKEQNIRSTHRIYENGEVGEVQIADEVVAIIAGLAATEVDGVAAMAGNITNELVGKLRRNRSGNARCPRAPPSVWRPCPPHTAGIRGSTGRT